MPSNQHAENRLRGAARLLLTSMLLMSFTTTGNKHVSDFSLRNTDGRFVSLKDYPGAKGFIIVFTCNHCPFAKMYFQRLNDLQKKYKPLGVPVIAISSTDTVNFEEDTWGKMRQKARGEKLNYPYLMDGQQSVARDFAAKKTPHAFVIWKNSDDWVVKYNGAIDDNGADPQKVQHHYISDAVDALLQGGEVAIPETKSVGCTIGLRR